MSRGQLPRVAAFFPRMKVRGARRRQRALARCWPVLVWDWDRSVPHYQVVTGVRWIPLAEIMERAL